MARTLSLEFQVIWKILVLGVLIGAGLPALFATGVRLMAPAAGADGEEHGAGAVPSALHPVARVLATACFAVVLAVVVLGLVYIVATGFGKVLSFEHVYPVITSKE